MAYPTYIAGDELTATDINKLACPVGMVVPFAAFVVPTNWLLCDGSAVSRSTYSDLFSTIVPSLGTFTVTIATPAVFSLTSHGLVAGDAVYFTTTGALPTGLSVNTIYYVISAGLTGSAFEVSSSRGGAAVNTSGSQSGTHTVRRCPFGLGDGSTTFNVPDLRQRAPSGYKSADTYTGYIGQTGGEQLHTMTEAEVAAHSHGVGYNTGSAGTANSYSDRGAAVAGSNTTNSTSGSATPFNVLDPYITLQYIIRY